MEQFDQWALPTGETHLQQWMGTVNRRVEGRLTYQYHKYEEALKHVPLDRHRVAIDVGAHVGLWSYWMARDFQLVIAYEPIEEHRALWRVNMANRPNATVSGVVLGERDALVDMTTGPSSSGDTKVVEKAGPYAMVPLDSLDVVKLAVDFIKLDCEGYEYFVLRGARRLIAKNRPTIIVEQKFGHGRAFGIADDAAVSLLQNEHGYRLRSWLDGDAILTPE